MIRRKGCSSSVVIICFAHLFVFSSFLSIFLLSPFSFRMGKYGKLCAGNLSVMFDESSIIFVTMDFSFSNFHLIFYLRSPPDQFSLSQGGIGFLYERLRGIKQIFHWIHFLVTIILRYLLFTPHHQMNHCIQQLLVDLQLFDELTNSAYLKNIKKRPTSHTGHVSFVSYHFLVACSLYLLFQISIF